MIFFFSLPKLYSLLETACHICAAKCDFSSWTLNAAITFQCHQQTQSFLTWNIRTLQQGYLAALLHIQHYTGRVWMVHKYSHFFLFFYKLFSCSNFPVLCLLKYLLYCPQKKNKPGFISGSVLLHSTSSTCYCTYLSLGAVSMWVVWREIYTLIFY